MIKYEYFEVVKNVKNYPYRKGDFIKGWNLGNNYVLGGCSISKSTKNEFVKAGFVKKVSKSYITEILISRHTY